MPFSPTVLPSKTDSYSLPSGTMAQKRVADSFSVKVSSIPVASELV